MARSAPQSGSPCSRWWEKGVYNLKTGDVIYLTSEIPGEWRNPGPAVARLLWVKVK